MVTFRNTRRQGWRIPLLRSGVEEYITVAAKGRFKCEESEVSPTIKNMENRGDLQRLPNK